MKLTPKILLRVSVFCLVTTIVLLFLNSFFKPEWTKWNNYYTTKGFYEEPENTIETVFLGASVMQSSVSPMEMYAEHGIDSYNLGTEQQPVLGSYYWLKETYDYHSETLKNVVFDVSALRSKSKDSFYHKCFDNMRFSKNKIQGAYEYKKKDIGDTVSFLVPLLSYHGRWSSLEESDFTKHTWEADTGTRGYYYIKNSYFRKEGLDGVVINSPILNENAEPAELIDHSLEYLDKMVKFCEEKGLKLVFVKTATRIWDSELHNAVQNIADSYGIEFYDFNFDPLFSTNGFIHAYDSGSDGKHLNYYGAHKFSRWMGDFLVKECGATDVRDNPKYDFMKDQYKEYEARVLQHVDLASSKSVTEYLSIAFKGQNTVLLSVKKNAVGALSEADKAFFRESGLTKFADLTAGDSYVAVVQNGQVLYEMTGSEKGTENPISYKGVLGDGKTTFRVESGGEFTGNTADIIIDEKSAMETGDGLNILVYSDELETALYTTRFNTANTTKRDNYGMHDLYILENPEEYNREYAPNSMRGLLKAYMQKLENIKKGSVSTES
ncbi:MAG: hypothetical protein IJN88_07985 [Clostridia bacterium]|nr:hypothetical protein [Clostridia bacterium]